MNIDITCKKVSMMMVGGRSYFGNTFSMFYEVIVKSKV